MIHIAIPGEHNYRISVGPAAAAATSPSISLAPLSSGLPSQSLTHQDGGSIGRCPSCSPGQTSAKKYQTCPTTTPSISSFGIDPCMHKLKAIRTHGSHGAVKTNIPRKLSRVSGLRRDTVPRQILACRGKGLWSQLGAADAAFTRPDSLLK